MTATKIIWIVATALNSLVILFCLVGTTAFFNRDTGSAGSYIYFMIIGIPVTILIAISIRCFIAGWMPRNNTGLIIAISIITIITVWLAPYYDIKIEGWLTESVCTLTDSLSSDILVQTTEDGKYEYFLEVVNPHQRNSRARLFVRSTATREETRIPLSMKKKNITISLDATSNGANAWSRLAPSEGSPSIYYLTTTEWLNEHIESFEINMETMTARRIE